MLRSEIRQSGLQGFCLVAVVYVYFLIFAQFAFLNRLAAWGVAGTHLKGVMAAMALGGILFSLLVPRVRFWPSPNLRLRIGFCLSGIAALLSLLPLGLIAAMAIACLIGAGLGLLTVTLVTHLRQWTGNRNLLLPVGMGTGAGYLICNLPILFSASSKVQTATAGLFCLAGIFITFLPAPAPPQEAELGQRTPLSFLRALACFTALVWLDSAAFFIIQNTPALKTGTWQGSAHLLTNGLLHLGAALAGVWLLRRRGLFFVLSAAFLALGSACLLLLHPDLSLLASICYPIGVSLYSVALVAFPSFLSPASTVAERRLQAGWLYAIAGWFGSAMGIGMGQNLGHIPHLFVLAAGAVVLLPWPLEFLLQRKRELALTVAVLLAALLLDRVLDLDRAPARLSQIEHGRQVYISEGCINCHSQYVRPGSADVLMWGPAESMEALRAKRPPLIGNRRQGPDLLQAGLRRSVPWLIAHFYDPPEVSGTSIMPSYGFLFRDQRGNDLVAYLSSLKGDGAEQHLAQERSWHLPAAAVAVANASQGGRVFQRYCATCHEAGGQTRWEMSFKRMPPDLTVGPYSHVSPSDNAARRMDRLAQIAKFGIPGTDMPGHEYLPDKDVASLSLWLSQIIARPSHNP
jgi:cytochrome c oxidase cbb3-type subunit 2